MKIKSLFFLLCCIVLNTIVASSQPMNSNDSTELISIAKAFGGLSASNSPIGWNALLPAGVQWIPGTNYSSWYGVDTIYDVTSGTFRVKGIDLGGLPLDNLLLNYNLQIDTLEMLEYIKLDSCFMTGALPIGLFSTALTQLQYIDISYNSFTHSTTFFNSFIATTTLTTLKARSCFNLSTVVGGFFLNTFFSNIEFLDVGANSLSGNIPSLSSSPYDNLRNAFFDDNQFTAIGTYIGNPNLQILKIAYNDISDYTAVINLLESSPNIRGFHARNALVTGLYTLGAIVVPTANPKEIDLGENNLQGTLNLDEFTSRNVTYLDFSFNSLDSVIYPSTVDSTLRFLILNHNTFNGEIKSALFSHYPNIERLHLNNNNFYGKLPEPIAGATGYYDLLALSRLSLAENPNLTGDLNLYWLLEAQVQAQNTVIKELYFHNNDFESVITPSPAPFSLLEKVRVEGNRFHFDDLFNIAHGLGMTQVSVIGSPLPFSQYVPAAWNTSNPAAPDTLASFVYHPQDSAGIGGVRRRPQGDSVFFASTVGYIPNIVNKVSWYRDSLGVNETIGGVAPTNISGGITTGVLVPNITALGTSVAPNATPDLMRIVSLDSFSHARWHYYARVEHDSFPLLTIPVRYKRLIVGNCTDSLGQPALCQQIVVQYRDNVSDSAKTALRNEFGIDVLDSCVCGAIELWAMPDTLNQIEVEQFGTGTRSTAGQARQKTELLSADQNYPLLGGTTPSTGTAPSFNQGSTHSNPTLVAIIDSGMDFDNPKLRKRIWVKPGESNNNGIDDDNDCEIDNGWGWNYLGRDNNSSDDHGHGTAVASVVGGYSTVNILPNNNDNDNLAIVPYKYTNAAGQGTVFHAACALRHAADYRDPLTGGQEARVRVINASWGYYGAPCIVLENAILYAGDQCDVLIVASSGNDGVNTSDISTDDTRHWPSNSPFVPTGGPAYVDNVISVAALGSNPDMLATYSNWSPTHIDIAATGTTHTFELGSDTTVFVQKTGTSFAAPQVARAAAMLFHEFPNATAGAVKNALILGVDTLQSSDNTKITSGGRLNYAKARQILQNTMNPTLCANEGYVVGVEKIEDQKENALAKVYPNPFQTALRIDFDLNQVNAHEDIIIQLISIEGKQMFQYQINNQSSFELPVSDLPAGMYFIQIEQETQKQIHKVVKF